MTISKLTGTSVSTIHVARALPYLTLCLMFVVLTGPAWAFELQSYDTASPYAESSETNTADGNQKNLSCAAFLDRAEQRRRDFSESAQRVNFIAKPKSLGFVVGIRISLGPESVRHNKTSSLSFWKPGVKNGRDSALADYHRCRSGQAFRALYNYSR